MDSTFTLALLTGMSVLTVSAQVVANLGWDKVKAINPVFAGDGDQLMYAARTRNGVTPASRAELFKKLKPLEIAEGPFANLPEKKAGRWGEGLTASKMERCRWLKPELVGQFEFVEWTGV